MYPLRYVPRGGFNDAFYLLLAPRPGLERAPHAFGDFCYLSDFLVKSFFP